MGRGTPLPAKRQSGAHLRRRVILAAHGPSSKDGAPTPLLRWQGTRPAHHRSRGRCGRGVPLALVLGSRGVDGQALHFGRCGQAYRPRAGDDGDSDLTWHGGGAGDGFRKKDPGLLPSPRLPRCGVTRAWALVTHPFPRDGLEKIVRTTRTDLYLPPPLWGAARHDRRLDSSKMRECYGAAGWQFTGPRVQRPASGKD